MKNRRCHRIVNIMLLCIFATLLFISCTSNNGNKARNLLNDQIDDIPDKSTLEETNPQGEFLGAKYSDVEQIIMTLDEISVYYDLKQDYQIQFAKELNEALFLCENMIESKEDTKLEALNEQRYVAVNPEHYYLRVLFSKSQDIIHGDTKSYDCDEIIIDLSDQIIYIRLEEVYKVLLHYEDDNLQSILSYVQKDIDSVS